MFFGKWNTKVDEKWRLYLPPQIKKELGDTVLIKEEESDGCLSISKVNSLTKKFSEIKNP